MLTGTSKGIKRRKGKKSRPQGSNVVKRPWGKNNKPARKNTKAAAGGVFKRMQGGREKWGGLIGGSRNQQTTGKVGSDKRDYKK